MKRILFLICGMLLMLGEAAAQTTAVTATVVDSDTVTWANGTWAVDFVANPANPYATYYFNGAAIPSSMLHQSGSMNSSGALSFTVDQNSAITPVGSTWNLKVCPDATAQCTTYNFTAIGSSMDLSSYLTSTIAPPRFRAIAGTYGYADVEAQLSLNPGSTYWNVISTLQRCYTGTAWTNCGGGGTVNPAAQWSIYGQIGTGTQAAASPLPNIAADSAGDIIPAASITKVSPVYDIRAYGAVMDNTTDIGPALQAAYNAATTATGSSHSETIFLPCGTGTTSCYWANPTSFVWKTGVTVNLKIQGNINIGSTLYIPSDVTTNFLCDGGTGAAAQFQPQSLSCSIAAPAADNGVLGTACSTTDGTAQTCTFTPSNMAGIYPNSAITIAGPTTCNITSVSINNGFGTLTLSSSCHIPEGVPITVAGSSLACTNGSYASGTYNPFMVAQSDYVANTITYGVPSGCTGSGTGGTVTGLNGDTVEDVVITSTTASTFTATVYRPHLATDQYGLIGIYTANGTQSIEMRGLNIGAPGTALFTSNYLGYFDKIGISQSGACSGKYYSFALTADGAYNHWDNSAILAACQPYSVHMYNNYYNSLGGTGQGFFNNDFLLRGIQIDHGVTGVYLKNSNCDQCGSGAVIYDPRYGSWNTNQSLVDIDNLLFNDNPSGMQISAFYQTMPSYLAVSGQVGPNLTVKNLAGATTRSVNEYFDGQLKSAGASYAGINKSLGIVGTYNDGKVMDGNLRGIGANFYPSLIPYATANITTNPASWPTNYCTVTPGTLGPDGTANAGTLTAASAGTANVGGSGSITPEAGDIILFGGWAYTPTLGSSPTSGPGGVSFEIITNSTAHFTLYNQNQYGQYSANDLIKNDWWAPVTGMTYVTASDGTSGQSVNLYLQCGPNITMEYFNPWMIYIPASAGVSLAEAHRWEKQLLHAYVPPNAVAGTLVTDPFLNIFARHYIARGTPTIACGTGAGTSPSVCTVTGNDEAGVINVTTGTSPAGSATIATITLANACPTSVYAVSRGANAAASGLSGTTHEYPDNFSAGSWTLTANSTGLAASTAYAWSYIAKCN